MNRIKYPVKIDGINKMRYFELPSNYTHNPGESHEAYELIFLERGLFLDTSEDTPVIMKPGDAVVYGQHYFHRTVCDGKSSAVVVILTFYSDSPALKEYLSGRHYFKVTPEQQKLLANILSLMPKVWDINSHECDTMSDASPYLEQICINYIEILFCQFIEQLDTETRKSDQGVFMESTPSEDPTVCKIIETLKSNIYGSLNYDQLCSDLGYSKSYIARIFKVNMGYTVMDYYLNLKIGEAKRLLLETHMNIDAIAGTLQFESPQYFSKVFKKRTGMTPKYFRNKIFKGSVVQQL